MKIDEIRQKLRFFKLTEVSKETGITYPVLRNMMTGSSQPKYENVQKIIVLLKWVGAQCVDG